MASTFSAAQVLILGQSGWVALRGFPAFVGRGLQHHWRIIATKPPTSLSEYLRPCDTAPAVDVDHRLMRLRLSSRADHHLILMAEWLVSLLTLSI